MPKKSVKPKKAEKPVVKEEKVVVPEETFVPETVDDGVTREEKKETPMDLVENTVKVRKKGKWIKASLKEIADFEARGLLIGYDPAAGEVLLKEEK
ncbi:MAG: hypothetical protein U9O94_01465 [Nanoarchaeota archaeon]|nr:hypothetical protein [Nanoarchaeota archaeon]